MTCDNCINKTPIYNMNQLCCIARHVLYRFYAKDESAKKYAIEVAKKYQVDVNEFKAEIIKRIKVNDSIRE